MPNEKSDYVENQHYHENEDDDYSHVLEIRNKNILSLREPLGACLFVEFIDWENQKKEIQGTVIDKSANYLRILREDGDTELLYPPPTHRVLEVLSNKPVFPVYSETLFHPRLQQNIKENRELLKEIEARNCFILCSVFIPATNTTMRLPGTLTLYEEGDALHVVITNSQGYKAFIDPGIFTMKVIQFEDGDVEKNLRALEIGEDLRLYDYNKKVRDNLVDQWYEAIAQRGESPLTMPETYQYLLNEVDDILLLLKRYETTASKMDALESKVAPLIDIDERLLVCLFHPVVYGKVSDFIRFVQKSSDRSRYIAYPHYAVSDFLDAIRRKVDSKTLYRGLVLRESEARSIREHGMLAAGMLNEVLAKKNLSALLAPYMGCVEGKFTDSIPADISHKLDDISFDNESMMLSVTEFPDIAASVGYHSSKRSHEEYPDLKLYMCVIKNLDPVRVIEHTLLFGKISGLTRAVFVGDTRFSGDPVELFVPFVIPSERLQIYEWKEQQPPKWSN